MSIKITKFFVVFFSFFFFPWISLIIWLWVAWSSLCRLGWAWIHRELSALASWMQGLKMSTTMPRYHFLKYHVLFFQNSYIIQYILIIPTHFFPTLPASQHNPRSAQSFDFDRTHWAQLVLSLCVWVFIHILNHCFL